MNLLFTWRPTSVPVQAVAMVSGATARHFLIQIEDHVARALGNEDGIGETVRCEQIANHVFERERLPYGTYSTSGCSQGKRVVSSLKVRLAGLFKLTGLFGRIVYG